MITASKRRLQGGVEYLGERANARVWAPACRSVDFVVDANPQHIHAMVRDADGFYAADAPVRPGDRYWFRLNGSDLRPDPCSRFQPDGPHGPSQVVDPSSYAWADGGWKGPASAGHVIYEMHVGTFTPEGSWAAAARELP